ncbi:MAG: GNAT family N-acetyltransferase [Mobilitalea sp.]
MNDNFQGNEYIGETKNLAIRIATTEDAKILCKWWSDGKVMAHAGFPNGIETDIQELKERISKEDDNNRRLIIEIDSIGVGEMSFRIDDNSADIGIKICDFSYQEKGFGTKAIKMLINYLFKERAVDKIVLDTNLNNTRAQHVYEKIGFQKVKINIDSWRDQVGVLQSFIEYELVKKAI